MSGIILHPDICSPIQELDCTLLIYQYPQLRCHIMGGFRGKYISRYVTLYSSSTAIVRDEVDGDEF